MNENESKKKVALAKKLFKKYMKYFCKETGFKARTDRLYYKMKGELFFGFTWVIRDMCSLCDVFIQPIYMPREYFILEIGGRLEKFSSDLYRSWIHGTTEEEISQEMEEIVSLLKNEVMQWYERNDTIEKIIYNLENNTTGLIRVKPHSRDQILGYSYARLGKLKEAKKHLNLYIEYCRNIDNPWVMQDEKHPVRSAIRLLEEIENAPHNVENLLDEYVRQTKESLKIE